MRSDITKGRNDIRSYGVQLAKSDMLGCSTLLLFLSQHCDFASARPTRPVLEICETADKIPKFWEHPLRVQFRVLSAFQELV